MTKLGNIWYIVNVPYKFFNLFLREKAMHGTDLLTLGIVLVIATVGLAIYLKLTGKQPARKTPGKKQDTWTEPKLIFNMLRYGDYTFESGKPVEVLALDRHGNVTDRVLGLRRLLGFTSKSRAVLQAGESTVNRSLRRLRPYNN